MDEKFESKDLNFILESYYPSEILDALFESRVEVIDDFISDGDIAGAKEEFEFLTMIATISKKYDEEMAESMDETCKEISEALGETKVGFHQFSLASFSLN